MNLIRPLLRDGAPVPHDLRYELAIAEVIRGRKDPTREARLQHKGLRELEALLRTTLVSAERSAIELREQAKREAETIVSEAHAEARTITREARAERERLALESRRIRVLLHAALDALDEADETMPAAGEEPESQAA